MNRTLRINTPLMLCILLLAGCSAQKNNSQVTPTDNGEKEQSGWQLGMALYSFHEHSFAEAIRKSDSANVSVVEGFSFHKMGKEFNDSAMGALSSAGIARMKDILNARNITMPSMFMGAGNAAQWISYFEMGKAMGMRFLVSEPNKSHWNLIDSLAGQYNMKVAIHQHSKAHGSLYWHPDTVLAAVTGRPNLGACADLGHWARSGLDPIEGLRKLEGHIISIHLVDVKDFTSTAPSVEAGTGVIDFNAVIKELKRQNFNGIIYVESENAPVQTLQYFKNLTDRGSD